jgi:hypothetical protein
MTSGQIARPKVVHGSMVAAVVVVTDERGDDVVRWPVVAKAPADLDTVDQLGRVLLAARRRGATARLVSARRDVVELLALVGLLGKMQRELEELEVLDPDEVVVTDDPIA